MSLQPSYMSTAFNYASRILHREATRQGLKDLKNLPGHIDHTFGPWNIRIQTAHDELNGDMPMTIYLKYDGWPAGHIYATGGIMRAEDPEDVVSLIHALKQELRDDLKDYE